MGTTLENGVYLPSEGERNCYAGLKTNWEILDQKVADVTALQQAVAGALHREIVESLPTTDIDPNTIYMILSGTSATENVYNEFMYVNNAWELIGTSATDLTNYYTKSEVDGKLLLKANASDLTSHTGDTTIHVTASDKTKWNTVALIKQLRLVNAQVGSATTIAFANIDDTNGIKVGDKCMDLDAKMFEITAVDTTNQTVTVGSALIDLALDANVVHTNEINSSGIGIIGAIKEVGGVDFNTLTTQGLYGANASGSTNNPESSPCVVQVIKRLNSVIQIANVSSSAYKSRYIRYCADITAQPPVWQSWIKFATDDAVVHTSGNETVGGNKTFSDAATFSSVNIDDVRWKSLTNQTVDLNDCYVSKSGVISGYYVASVSTGANISNKPTNTAFVLLSITTRRISVSDYQVIQKYYSSDGEYSRNCSNGTWSNWVKDTDKFVTTDTAQTIIGAKTFSSSINVYNSDSTTDTANIVLKNSKAERGSTTDRGEQTISFLDKDNAQIGQIKCEVDANGVSTLTVNCTNSSNSSSGIRLRRTSTGTFLQPTYNNVCNLGTTGYRWYDVQTRAINNLEPSSLSLPSDRSARIDISSYITNLGNGDNNQYIVPANGYIWLHFTSINSALCYSQTSGGLKNYAQTFVRYQGDGQLYAFFPVRNNDKFVVQIYTSSTAVVQNAYFIPCQGNV